MKDKDLAKLGLNDLSGINTAALKEIREKLDQAIVLQAEREKKAVALKQEVSKLIQKIVKTLGFSNEDAVRFVADTINVKLASPANSKKSRKASPSGRGRQSSLTEEQKKTITTLLEEGKSKSDITRKLFPGVNFNTAYSRVNTYVKKALSGVD